MLFTSADHIKMLSGLFFMMDVNIMNPEQTANHATYTIFCSG